MSDHRLLRCRYQRVQRGGALKAVLVTLVLLIVLGCVALGAGGYYLKQKITEPGPATTEQTILIESGMGVSSIAERLSSSGAISSVSYFKIAAAVREAGSQLRAGEYLIPAGSSINDIIDILLEGKAIVHRLTIPEGLTTAQVLRLIAADDTLEGEITLSPAEGDLLPETYGFTRGETRDEYIARMIRERQAVLDKLWPNRQEGLPFETKEQAVILASIVEKETGIAEERAQVASVFVNRLKRGIRLQSDPTIIYGLTKGEPLGRGLRVSEIKKKTDYNTYQINGLPPTPISNPGREAIAAVLNPADTNYLFFVADGTGGHAFAATLREHNANVAKWRAIERARKKG